MQGVSNMIQMISHTSWFNFLTLLENTLLKSYSHCKHAPRRCGVAAALDFGLVFHIECMLTANVCQVKNESKQTNTDILFFSHRDYLFTCHFISSMHHSIIWQAWQHCKLTSHYLHTQPHVLYNIHPFPTHHNTGNSAGSSIFFFPQTGALWSDV